MWKFKKTLMFAASVAGACVGAAEYPVVRPVAVVNGGFDEVKAGRTLGWNEVAPHYTYRDGEGRSGTRALRFENDDPTFYRFPAQKIDLKPGRSYEYEVWVRTENLVGEEGGATLCIEWNGPDGKWLGGAYAPGVKGTKGWTLVKGITPRIPEEARDAHISPYVRKGMTGKAWFDDVAVREYVPAPVEGLYSSAYRNLATTGNVTFRAAVNATLSDCSAGRTLVYTFRDEQDRPFTRRSMYPGSHPDAFGGVTVAVRDLKKGPQLVSVDLLDEKEKRLGGASCTFTRAETLPARTTWFDEYGRTIVNGKPFFPLGMYWGTISTNDLEVYAKGPFNCLMPYNSPNSMDLMDLCEAKGIKVIYSVKDIYSGTRWAPKGIETEADEVRFITDRVTRFKHHPALLAWYLNDELPLSMLARLTARRALMERLDPGHPGWVVLYQYAQIRDYLPTFDVVGTDPYPIPEKPAAVAMEWTHATRMGTLICKPLWQVPQAFNWAAYRKDPAEKKKCRAPTEAELRSMCWQCIANGANGLVMYSFFDLKKQPNGEPFAKRWAECCRVGEEIRAQMPVLLSVEGAGRRVVKCLGCGGMDADWKGPKRTIAARSWMKDGAWYVLVVNGYEKARDVRVFLLPDIHLASLESVFGPTPKLEPANELRLSLAPLEPALVRLTICR